MAEITASLVKELRERTGSGMMECKKALKETGGDIDAAVEFLRKSGQAKAEKKAGRTAAEGAIIIAGEDKLVAMVEVNCETDFVANDDHFQGFATSVGQLVLSANPGDVAALLATPLDGDKTVDQVRAELIAKIGENINVRRFVRLEASEGNHLSSYRHGNRIGVVVELQGGSDELGRDLAMHVAASRPVCVSAEQVPADLLAKERAIYQAQAEESGKADNIITKMVEGKVNKYLKEVTLVGQPFVKDPDQSVEKLLKSAGAQVMGFQRFELGEGIEKKVDNFVQDVMAQARGQ